jgi:hypothetical protein
VTAPLLSTDQVAWLRDAFRAAGYDARLGPADGLTLWQAAGHTGGWQLRRQILAQTAGLHRADDADPVTVNLVGACDGTRTLREVVTSLAAATDADEGALTAAALARVPRLVERGFLHPR